MTTTSISLTSGMRQNLYNLRSNTHKTEVTSRRLSTGLKVENALDNPINFFMAQEHRQRASDFMSRKDEMGEAIQTVKAASTGIESATALLMSAKSTAQAALSTSDTDEREDLADQFNYFRTQLDSLVEDSGYKGVNLLEDGSELAVIFNEKGTSSITIDGFDASASGLSIDEVGGGTTTSTGDMNFLGGVATATYMYWSNIVDTGDTGTIVNGTTDSVDLQNGAPVSPADRFNVDVNATSIKITLLEDVNLGNVHKILISGLTDQSGHTGTKINSIGGTLSDPDLVEADYTVNDTSVEIDLTGVAGLNGETIIINLDYEMTSGNDGWTENNDIKTSIDEINIAISTLRSQAKDLSNDLGTITTRQKFTSGLINTLNDGADNLTLADINLEGANMLMLQTRQSLSTTSLSLSSQASSSVLRLF